MRVCEGDPHARDWVTWSTANVVTMDLGEAPRKLWTCEDVAAHIGGGLTAVAVEAQTKRMLRLREARDDPAEWQRLWDALVVTRWPGPRTSVMVPNPHEPPLRVPPEGQEPKIIRGWKLYAKQESGRRTLSGYARWRRLNLGSRDWLLGRAAIDHAVKGELPTGHAWLPSDPAHDWRQLRKDGKLEKVVQALDRRAGLS